MNLVFQGRRRVAEEAESPKSVQTGFPIALLWSVTKLKFCVETYNEMASYYMNLQISRSYFEVHLIRCIF